MYLYPLKINFLHHSEDIQKKDPEPQTPLCEISHIFFQLKASQMRKSLIMLNIQILVLTAQPGGGPHQRHIIHSLPPPPPLSIYFYIRLAGNAVVWRQLQFPGGSANIEFRHDNQCSSHGVPGTVNRFMLAHIVAESQTLKN